MSEQSKEADKKRVQFWKYHLEQWSRSGLTQLAYCRMNNLKSNRLTYWKNKFKNRNMPVEFVQVSPVQISATFNSLPSNNLRLNVNSGFQIEIPDGFLQATLVKVLQVLGET